MTHTKYNNWIWGLLLPLLFSCVEEKDMSYCGKWQVEINNPGATVEIVDGRLVVDIPNPTSEKDVRLIQHQSSAHTSAEVGVWVDVRVFEAVPVDKASLDAQVRSSFAYASQPENLFLSLSTSNTAKRGYYYGEEIYFATQKLSNNMHGKSETIQFEVSHAYNAVQTVSPISAAPKIYYLDFGINPTLTRNNPTASIHAEIEMVIFGNYVDRPAEPMQGFPDEALGFLLDQFDCNSIID